MGFNYLDHYTMKQNRLKVLRKAVATILRRRTTKNSTLKKIAEVLGCSIEEIIIPPNGMADLKEKFEEKKVLLEAIEERINQLTDDKHLAKLYRIWLTKDLKEFFKVKSYGLISGKDMVAAIEIVRKWEPGVDIAGVVRTTASAGTRTKANCN